MKTDLLPEFLATADGKEANSILRTCVHCGFCNATCPTYQIQRDENDGPRGRIYLIQQLLEGKEASKTTQQHLDRCLTCQNCETTCPSGVSYSHLLEIGRKHIEEKVPRTLKTRLLRVVLLNTLPYKYRFKFLLKLGRIFKPLIPKNIKKKIPKTASSQNSIRFSTQSKRERRMIILEGCVQPSLSPDINLATERVLDKLGISLIRPKKVGCCGAVSLHLSAEKVAHQFMRKNIDAWWPDIENGVEAIIMTASGCGVTVKDYAYQLRNDPDYAMKAKKVSSLCKDIAEIIEMEDLDCILKTHTSKNTTKTKVSFHPPCTLQHGQKINGVVESILSQCNYELLPIIDSHLCCGSAGTYSILQQELSTKLQNNKIHNLQTNKPDFIATSNIGCQTHLQEVTKVPVKHWIHLLETVIE